MNQAQAKEHHLRPNQSETKTYSIAQGTKKFPITDFASLSQYPMKGISMRFADTAGDRRSANGVPLLPLSMAKRSFFSVKKNQKQIHTKTALETYNIDNINAVNEKYIKVDFQVPDNSMELDFGDWTGIPAGIYDVEITFHYYNSQQ